MCWHVHYTYTCGHAAETTFKCPACPDDAPRCRARLRARRRGRKQLTTPSTSLSHDAGGSSSSSIFLFSHPALDTASFVRLDETCSACTTRDHQPWSFDFRARSWPSSASSAPSLSRTGRGHGPGRAALLEVELNAVVPAEWVENA